MAVRAWRLPLFRDLIKWKNNSLHHPPHARCGLRTSLSCSIFHTVGAFFAAVMFSCVFFIDTQSCLTLTWFSCSLSIFNLFSHFFYSLPALVRDTGLYFWSAIVEKKKIQNVASADSNSEFVTKVSFDSTERFMQNNCSGKFKRTVQNKLQWTENKEFYILMFEVNTLLIKLLIRLKCYFTLFNLHLFISRQTVIVAAGGAPYTILLSSSIPSQTNN